MRIVIPVTCLERGGGIRFLVELGNGLTKRGHDVTFVVLAGERRDYAVLGRVCLVPRLQPEFMPPGDLVLPNFYLTVPCSLSGRAMPARICLGYEPLFVGEAKAAEDTYRIPMPIAAISRWLQGILRQRVGRHSVVINPGLDWSVFHPGNVPRHPATVVCLARHQRPGVYWFKGFPQFVQAMALVHTRYPGVRAIVASPDLPQLETPFPAVLLRNPSDRQLADLYRQATVFVFPSLLEGFGLPPLEAMACGAPVVTTACGGVSDYARDGENCLMVPPGGAVEMSQAILRLLGDASLRIRLSGAGVDTARPWTWGRTVSQAEQFLEAVARGRFTL